MKFTTLEFHRGQAQFVKIASERIVGPPLFRPDGKTTAQIVTFITDLDTSQTAFMNKYDALNIARGQLEAARGPAHAACVDVFACMKSCYRTLEGELVSIKALPKDDRTAAQTFTRAKAISQRWAALPPPPSSAAFQVGAITQPIFNELWATLETRLDAHKIAHAEFQSAQVALSRKDDEITNFITAALAQGRAAYKEGTTDRAYIDAVPAVPSTELPAQAVIGLAESQAEGAVHLAFEAAGATSFSVWHKGPGEAQFTQIAESLQPGEYLAVGQPGGGHAYKVVGRNSRGDGPASEVVTLNVAAVAAA